jgi:site-specific DNA-cytosine methylase
MIDIEEMGCSGETFLAACELLFKEKPKYAIFENVEKAVSHPRLVAYHFTHKYSYCSLTMIHPSLSSRGAK